MYRLLIVTGNPNVKEMLTAMEGWEKMGFKPPRLFDTAEAAMEGLRSFKSAARQPKRRASVSAVRAPASYSAVTSAPERDATRIPRRSLGSRGISSLVMLVPVTVLVYPSTGVSFTV